MTSEPRFRRATQDDLGSLNELYATAFTQRATLSDVLNPLMIIMVDDEVRTTKTATIARGPGKWNAYTAFAVTHPEHRGRGLMTGVTRALCRELDSFSAVVGEPMLVLSTIRPDRLWAIKAELAAGFTRLARSTRGGWDLLGYWAGVPGRPPDRRVVLTTGVWDLLHVGHVNRLRQARDLGTELVVAVQESEAVAAVGGKRPPIQSTAERVAMIEALGWADRIITYRDGTDPELIHRVRPDVFVQGDDWADAADRTRVLEALRVYDADVVLGPRTPNVSTTEIRRRVEEST